MGEGRVEDTGANAERGRREEKEQEKKEEEGEVKKPLHHLSHKE